MTVNNCHEKCFPKNSVFSRQKREILYFVTVFFSSIHFLRYITVIVGQFSSSDHFLYDRELRSFRINDVLTKAILIFFIIDLWVFFVFEIVVYSKCFWVCYIFKKIPFLWLLSSLILPLYHQGSTPSSSFFFLCKLSSLLSISLPFNLCTLHAFSFWIPLSPHFLSTSLTSSNSSSVLLWNQIEEEKKKGLCLHEEEPYA